MAHFKHIIISVLWIAGLSLAVHSQSTALAPFEGATHTYQWSGLQSGLNYEFYFTTDASGSVVLDDIATGEFDFNLSPAGTIEAGSSTVSVPIQWHKGASLHLYYLWLKVSNPDGCSNCRYVGIQPQLNRFDLLSENIPVDNTVSCPAVASTDGFNPLAPAYDAGTTTLKFIVRRVNGTDNKLTAQTGDTYNWSFQPVLSVDPAFIQGISIVSIIGVNSGKLVPDVNNLYSVTGTDNEVTVTVAVKNVPGTSQDVKLMIKNQGESRTNLPDSNLANDSVKHRIEVMPVIESLQGV
jgi:hypothetical protein